LSAVDNRAVYIWGTSHIGRSVFLALQKHRVTPAGFIDGRVSEAGKTAFGLPVCLAEEKVKDPGAFIIIANLLARRAAEDLCRRYGRVKGVSYLTHYQIARPEAVIDVSGMCNLACPSCPRGNMDGLLPEGWMPLDTYRRVLEKLSADIPLLINVDLSMWGEPFCNPDLPRIISHTEQTVSCTVSTNLQVADMIEPVIGAAPGVLNITVNGVGEAYERNMKGASWARILANVEKAGRAAACARGETIIRILGYGFGGGAEEARLASLAERLNIPLVHATAYVNPYEHYAALAAEEPLSPLVRMAIENSTWNVRDYLDRAREDRDKPCLCQRIFPVINWNTSVALCHTYYGPVIAESYLDLSWEDLLAVRHGAPQCSVCQEQGLHRLDVDVLRHRGTRA
ncbi:MAG: radical SAM protein, partial [Patescibacteria group bacterium]|nr:radical SAM protein [Patescibacteria group bacterium]